LEIANEQAGSPSRRCQARVAWVRKSRNLPGLFQVGVEFEAPGNVWDLADPPEDWQQPSVSQELDTTTFEREMNELLALIESGTYYQLLQVTSETPLSQVKHNYYELVRKFHPDRHMANVERMHSLHKLMDAITLAYKTLTDDTARTKYDQRLAASGTFTLGRHQSESQKTAEECMEKARECFRAQNHGGCILWLRKAVDIEPNSVKYRALLARSLSVLPPFRREAIEHFQKAIEIDPWNTTLHFQLAALYELMKLPWRACEHYQKVLEIDAENSKARERLLLLDAETGKNRTARRNLIDRLFRHFHK
jgi:tetratricopeptide (TPR) repeat protein